MKCITGYIREGSHGNGGGSGRVTWKKQLTRFSAPQSKWGELGY